MKGGDREREKDFLSDFVHNLTTSNVYCVVLCGGKERSKTRSKREKVQKGEHSEQDDQQLFTL
jgi:hypothetical protein